MAVGNRLILSSAITLGVALVGLACHRPSESAGPAASHPSSSGATKASASVRSQEIRAAIEKSMPFGGGHSPVPRRVVNDQTFKKVRQLLGQSDIPALLLLVLDDAYPIRSLAASLLECLDPYAKADIEEQLRLEIDDKRKDRYYDALIAIDGIKSGGTSCK